jgi:GntR family transcriptional regulator
MFEATPLSQKSSQKSAQKPAQPGRARQQTSPVFDPLDQAHPLPVYAQVQERLKAVLEQGLRSGQYKPGDFFTTEKDLCRQFQISAITAKRALDELEAAGVLVRQRGRGTFLAQPRFPQVLDHFYRFTTYMREHGFTPSSRTLAVRTAQADAHVASALGLKRKETVVEIDRLRLVNGEPFFLQTSSLPLSLLPGLDKLDHDSQSLYEILSSRYHLPPTRCTDTFEPVLLRKHEVQLLQTQARIPGLLLERIAYSGDTPVEFSRGVIRGDRCRLTVDLR